MRVVGKVDVEVGEDEDLRAARRVMQRGLDVPVAQGGGGRFRQNLHGLGRIRGPYRGRKAGRGQPRPDVVMAIAPDDQQKARGRAEIVADQGDQLVAPAIGAASVRKPGLADPGGRARADGEDRQPSPGVGRGGQRGNGVAAGQDDRVERAVRRRLLRRLHVEERRDHGLVTARGQFAGAALGVRLRAEHEDAHASSTPAGDGHV